MPSLLQTQKNKKINDSKVVITSSEAMSKNGCHTCNHQNAPKNLYILDVVKIKSIVGLNSDDIESIQVLKGKESTREYGEQEEAGVVLISSKGSKKQYRK